MGRIYRRGNRYYVDYEDNKGKRIRKSAGSTRQQAREFLRSQGQGIEESTSLQELLDDYLEGLEVHAKRNSITEATYCARRLSRFFGDSPVMSLTVKDCDAFIGSRRKQGITNKTINGDLIVLRAAFNYGVTVGLIPRVPFKVKLLKAPRRRINRILTKREVKKVLECAEGRIFGILLIAAHTGFRTDEILHLQWKDVGWEDCSLRVSTKDGIWSSKNHQERKVFVSLQLIEWLRIYRKDVTFSGKGDWIFSTRTRRPMAKRNVCRAVKKVFEQAGSYEKGTPTIHLIRHTVACTLLGNGTDLETVRDWLGHADISTTSIYLHTTDERKRAAAEKLKLVA